MGDSVQRVEEDLLRFATALVKLFQKTFLGLGENRNERMNFIAVASAC